MMHTCGYGDGHWASIKSVNFNMRYYGFDTVYSCSYTPKFWRNKLRPSPGVALRMPACSSETVVPIITTTNLLLLSFVISMVDIMMGTNSDIYIN